MEWKPKDYVLLIVTIGAVIVFGASFIMWSHSETRFTADDLVKIEGAEISTCERHDGAIWRGRYCDWDGNN